MAATLVCNKTVRTCEIWDVHNGLIVCDIPPQLKTIQCGIDGLSAENASITALLGDIIIASVCVTPVMVTPASETVRIAIRIFNDSYTDNFVVNSLATITFENSSFSIPFDGFDGGMFFTILPRAHRIVTLSYSTYSPNETCPFNITIGTNSGNLSVRVECTPQIECLCDELELIGSLEGDIFTIQKQPTNNVGYITQYNAAVGVTEFSDGIFYPISCNPTFISFTATLRCEYTGNEDCGISFCPVTAKSSLATICSQPTATVEIGIECFDLSDWSVCKSASLSFQGDQCVLSTDYWINNPERYPIDGIIITGVVYPSEDIAKMLTLTGICDLNSQSRLVRLLKELATAVLNTRVQQSPQCVEKLVTAVGELLIVTYGSNNVYTLACPIVELPIEADELTQLLLNYNTGIGYNDIIYGECQPIVCSEDVPPEVCTNNIINYTIALKNNSRWQCSRKGVITITPPAELPYTVDYEWFVYIVDEDDEDKFILLANGTAANVGITPVDIPFTVTNNILLPDRAAIHAELRWRQTTYDLSDCTKTVNAEIIISTGIQPTGNIIDLNLCKRTQTTFVDQITTAINPTIPCSGTTLPYIPEVTDPCYGIVSSNSYIQFADGVTRNFTNEKFVDFIKSIVDQNTFTDLVGSLWIVYNNADQPLFCEELESFLSQNPTININYAVAVPNCLCSVTNLVTVINRQPQVEDVVGSITESKAGTTINHLNVTCPVGSTCGNPPKEIIANKSKILSKSLLTKRETNKPVRNKIKIVSKK